jgi:hypothetical protein
MKKRKYPPQSLLEWAIQSPSYGLWFGAFASRREAIQAHCRDCGVTWKEARKLGRRAIKVNVFPYSKPFRV